MEQTKTLDQYFCDWESAAFGYGYGTGESPVLDALKQFAELTTKDSDGEMFTYDYEILEKNLGPPVTWLLIDALCKDGTIDYGTSPRYGWFLGAGATLIKYLRNHSVEEMYKVVMAEGPNEGYYHCFKDHCNCSTSSSGEPCKLNPFWNDRVIESPSPGQSL